MASVLSVDDSRIMRKMIGNAAETIGYDLLEAEDGRKALDVLEANIENVDLILLDINMPVMNGIETLEAIKADDRFKEIPVVMVTTETSRASIVEAIKMGAANYVCKPFTQEELTTKMVESIGMGF